MSQIILTSRTSIYGEVSHAVVFFFILNSISDYVHQLDDSQQWFAGELAAKMIFSFGKKLEKDWDTLPENDYDPFEHLYPFSNASTESVFGQMR